MLMEQRTQSDWLRLIHAEYREMPGLHLTKPQVQRLWGLDTGDVRCAARSTIERELPQKGHQRDVRARGRRLEAVMSAFEMVAEHMLTEFDHRAQAIEVANQVVRRATCPAFTLRH